MVLEKKRIPALDIGPIPLASGTRVAVHPVSLRHVLRVPLNPNDDWRELESLDRLKIFTPFLPQPEIVLAEIGREVRELILCDKVDVQGSKHPTTLGLFSSHLCSLTIDEAVSFLGSMRSFVDTCKAAYGHARCLPDLIGPGNFVPFRTDLFLLDTNNLVLDFDPKEGEKVEVPLDDQGIPIFDLSLHLLYEIEKTLLAYDEGGNFSSQSFNRRYRKDRNTKGTRLPRELSDSLRPRVECKRDHFYGALRLPQRRQIVRRYIDNCFTH